MELKKINTNQSLLFDGLNDEFYEYRIQPLKSFNGNEFSFRIHQCKSIERLKNEVGDDKYAELIMGMTNFRPSKHFQGLLISSSGFSVQYYIGELNNRRFLTLVSDGESQPGRYKIYLEGVWELL